MHGLSILSEFVRWSLMFYISAIREKQGAPFIYDRVTFQASDHKLVPVLLQFCWLLFLNSHLYAMNSVPKNKFKTICYTKDQAFSDKVRH